MGDAPGPGPAWGWAPHHDPHAERRRRIRRARVHDLRYLLPLVLLGLLALVRWPSVTGGLFAAAFLVPGAWLATTGTTPGLRRQGLRVIGPSGARPGWVRGLAGTVLPVAPVVLLALAQGTWGVPLWTALAVFAAFLVFQLWRDRGWGPDEPYHAFGGLRVVDTGSLPPEPAGGGQRGGGGPGQQHEPGSPGHVDR